MTLTNTPISAHDQGTRQALQPRVAHTSYFTRQNWNLALVVICDQTRASVFGTRLLFEFEARNGFMTDILKYIKISFAGGVFQPLLFGSRACVCSGP